VFVGEIGGKKMCVEGCGRGEVFEILKDTWHATLTNVSTSLLGVQPCSGSDGLF
jgi:hypothetical protein